MEELTLLIPYPSFMADIDIDELIGAEVKVVDTGQTFVVTVAQPSRGVGRSEIELTVQAVVRPR